MTEELRWEPGSCDCANGPLESEVVYDSNIVARCPRCNYALGGDPVADYVPSPATDAGEVRSGLIAELRNPWEQLDGEPRGKLPFWVGDLLSRAADALETQAPAETAPRPQFHEVLKLMRETMESHPFWRKVVGTPAVNDLPVRAAVVAMDLLAAIRRLGE